MMARHPSKPYRRRERKEVSMCPQQLVPLVVTFFAILTVAAAKSTGFLALPPVIVESPEPHVFYEQGKHIALECKAEGTPPLKYQWYKNNEPLDDSSPHVLDIIHATGTGSTLHLRVAQGGETGASENLKDALDGKYQCTVTNGAGGAVAMSDVSVLEKRVFSRPEKKSLHIIQQEEGLSLRIPCNHTKSSSPPLITWSTVMCPVSGLIRGCRSEYSPYLTEERMKDGRVMQLEDGSLFFAHIEKSDMRVDGKVQRIYKCSAEDKATHNEFGGSDTKIIVRQEAVIENVVPHCDVDNSHQVALAGDKIQLSCFCKGRPTPSIKWRQLHPDTTLVEESFSGGVLTLERLSYNNTGLYKCTGSNTAGEHMALVQLDVHSKPEFTVRPTSQILSVGMSSTLHCEGEGVPEPDITWYFNDQPIEESPMDVSYTTQQDGTSLVLQDVQLNDTMTVHCRLSNKHGTVTAGAYLVVTERAPTTPPPSPPPPMPTTQATNNEDEATTTTTSSNAHIYVSKDKEGSYENNVTTKDEDIKDPYDEQKEVRTIMQKEGDKGASVDEKEGAWGTSQKTLLEDEEEGTNAIHGAGEYGSGRRDPLATADPQDSKHSGGNWPRATWFLLFALFASIFVVIVTPLAIYVHRRWRKAQQKKREYHVDEQESRWGHGESLAGVQGGLRDDVESYNSDDSGYDEKEGLRKKRKNRSHTIDTLDTLDTIDTLEPLQPDVDTLQIDDFEETHL